MECSAKLQSQEGKCYTKAKHKERLSSKTRRQTKGKDESKRGQLVCRKGLKNIHTLEAIWVIRYSDCIYRLVDLNGWPVGNIAGSITEVLCVAGYFI